MAEFEAFKVLKKSGFSMGPIPGPVSGSNSEAGQSAASDMNLNSDQSLPDWF